MGPRSIYDFSSYKSYLLAQEQVRARGFRAELAKVTGCQSTYVTKILNSNTHFSLEQAFKINKWLGHDEEESRHFILIVEHNRAGTEELRQFFSKQLEESLQSYLNLKNRADAKDNLNLEDKTRYYSDWYYVAVHILISIKEFNSIEAIAKHLHLNLATVTKVVRFLTSCGLAEFDANKNLRMGESWIHLEKESPFIIKHHTNWRLKAIQSFEQESERELHYTSVISLSQSDVLKLKTLFVNSIDKYNEIVRPSKEEACYCLCLDFFKV